MTDEPSRPSPADGSQQLPETDLALEDLRQILFGQQVARLEEDLDDLERRISDRNALIAVIAPVLGDAIRRQIRDARQEMIEALYPIVGQLVMRAVSEAIRDLARNIDAQMRTSFSPAAIWRRLQARLSGVSAGELALRDTLPFVVAEIFLIHRESGLLLRHISRAIDRAPDSDLISGMLTAIRDFAGDAFGRGREGELEEIQYGERRILIEAARYAYLAVVVDGIEPPGFRAEMRERIISIDHTYAGALRDYQGDATQLAAADAVLRTLMPEPRAPGLSPVQKRVLAGASGLVAVCMVGACLGGGWVWRAARATPVASVAPVPSSTATPTASATPTPSPSATMTPTPTLTPQPSATPTATPTATPLPTSTPATVAGIMTGNVWLRQEPAADALRLGVVLTQGQAVEVLAAYADWYRVRWGPQDGAAVSGWVPARWVGTVTSIPAWMVTPGP